MPSQLSHADVKKLLAEPSVPVRTEIAKKLVQEIDNPRLSGRELALAHEVVRLMADDIEVSVRHALSHSLRSAARLPHDIAIKLANDIETVALPVLEHSGVLTDEDLIAIVGNGSPLKHEAIARRDNVSENVSDALIANAGENAVALLMKNRTAHIAEQSFDKAIERFKKNDLVKTAIVMRASLPITVAERLAVIVSDRLRDYLVSHHDMSAEMASDLVLQSRERTVVNFALGGSEDDVEKLVMQMHRNQRLTASIVVRALCTGDMVFFETALAVMANVPLVNARILIHDGGYLGLKSLYEKSGMSSGLLPVVREAMEIARETKLNGAMHDMERYRARVIERILTQAPDIDSGDLDYLLKKLGDVIQVSVA